MTREEAIKILKAIRVYECYPKSASEETKEAIDMAIEALSAEAVHNDSCGGCKHIVVIERCEQCRRIYAEFDDLYDKGGDSE